MPNAYRATESGQPAGQPPNIVVVLSDEHAGSATGYAGHPQIRTPHLDALSRQAWTFDNAYCTSPMCVPSRMSLLSGRYVHDIGAWDNGMLPDPTYRTWGHHLRPAGYHSTLVGRTHFNGPDRLLGFDDRLCDDLDFWVDHAGRPPRRDEGWRRRDNSHVSECGAGDHVHTRYDERVTDLAIDYLRRRAASPEPFLLYVGYMHPHFPLVAPPEFLSWYDPSDIQLPATWNVSPNQQHPAISLLRKAFRNDEPLSEETARLATACYWALVSHLDHQVGRLLRVLDGNTVVIYASDHGELAGQHGIWQKQCFYQDSVRVPLLVRLPGAGVPARIGADVSLVDLLPTLRDLAGLGTDPDLPGISLRDVVAGSAPCRPVFAEYHAQGMATGGYMVKCGAYKYCVYVGHPPQLFDLDDDPQELADLANSPAYQDVRASMAAQLEAIVDPIEVDRIARANQASRAENARARVND